DTELALRDRYKVHKPIILYVGGMDQRKNMHGLIRAFALLPAALKNKYQLVIACHVTADEKARFGKEVIFTGYVPEDDLILFYHLCDLLVFPSFHEGFGLPVLEAMQCGAAVIGSNTSSIPEVIGRKDALFDPHNDQEIAQKIQQALTDTAFH